MTHTAETPAAGSTGNTPTRSRLIVLAGPTAVAEAIAFVQGRVAPDGI